MTESKHTPGPWNVVLCDDGALMICTVGDVVLVDDNHLSDANARLIAAAPDLLKALRPFAEHPDEWTVDTVRAAIAALAKAEGQS